jgi:hypothetical protein
MTKKVFWKKYGGKHYFISEATFKVWQLLSVPVSLSYI